MKTLRLVAIIVALTALPVQGQLEFSGGMNLSQLSGALGGTELQNTASRTGMVFGLDVIVPMGGLGLNLGADWSQRGVEDIVPDPATQQPVPRLIELQYIAVPLHVRVPIASAGPTRINLVLGPTFGFRTGCNVTQGTDAVQKCGQVTDGPDFSKTDIGGTAGLGISFSLGGILYAGFDVRYTTGMTSINNVSGDSLKDRTLTLQTHVGIDIF
jgi:hypothetical protein